MKHTVGEQNRVDRAKHEKAQHAGSARRDTATMALIEIVPN